MANAHLIEYAAIVTYFIFNLANFIVGKLLLRVIFPVPRNPPDEPL